MKYLLTGSTGFLGKIILNSLPGFRFITLGRSGCNIIADLSRQIPEIPEVDIVIHAAGKAHSVPKSDEEIRAFYDVNVTGTLNLLKGLELNTVLPQSFIFISSVAVYGKESGTAIDESSPLAAKDAYGKSKIEAEQIIQAWCAKHQVKCSIFRLPLIAGPNPPGNLRAMVLGIKKGYYFNIGGGKARKSIVLAQDVARIIPGAAQVGGIFNLTDGYHPSFSELSLLIAKQLGKAGPHNMPEWLAGFFAKAGDIVGPKAPVNSDKLRKITSDLTFDDSRARRELNWKPNQVLKEFRIE